MLSKRDSHIRHLAAVALVEGLCQPRRDLSCCGVTLEAVNKQHMAHDVFHLFNDIIPTAVAMPDAEELLVPAMPGIGGGGGGGSGLNIYMFTIMCSNGSFSLQWQCRARRSCSCRRCPESGAAPAAALALLASARPCMCSPPSSSPRG